MRLLKAQEAGAYGALVCLAEVLTPSQRSIYEQLGQNAKAQERLANLKRAELDMTPDATSCDNWWVSWQHPRSLFGSQVVVSRRRDFLGAMWQSNSWPRRGNDRMCMIME